MLNTFLREWQDIEAMQLQKYFEIIRLACSTQPNSILMLGNAALFMAENAEEELVPYLLNSGDKKEDAVELYSDDGYYKIEDIAHWADIVMDYMASKAAGEELWDSRRIGKRRR